MLYYIISCRTEVSLVQLQLHVANSFSDYETVDMNIYSIYNLLMVLLGMYPVCVHSDTLNKDWLIDWTSI